LALALLVLIVLSAGAAVVVRRLRRGRRSAAHAAALDDVARRLGLAIEPRSPHVVRGELRDVPVEISWRERVGTPPGASSPRRFGATTVVGLIQPPLRLDLAMKWGVSRAPEKNVTGVPELDARFRTTGDPESLHAFFDGGAAPLLSDALMRLPPAAWRMDVSDRRVRVEGREQSADAATLAGVVELVADTAAGLAAVRRSLALVEWERELAAAWGAVARKRGLRFDREGLSLDADGTAGRVRCWLDRQDGAWVTELDVRFRKPLRRRLRVYRQGELHRVGRAVDLADIRIGEPEFDRLFAVQGHTPAIVRRLMGVDVRRALMSLAPHVEEMLLDDEGLRVAVAGAVRDADDIDRLLTLCHEVVSSVVARGPAPAAYR
jgi:acyl-coenzyme A thioesterase PaaI-like protein